MSEPTQQQIDELAYQIHAKAHAAVIGTKMGPLGLSDAYFLARQELGAEQPKITGPEKETPAETGARVTAWVNQMKALKETPAAQAEKPAAVEAEAAQALGGEG